MDGTRKYYILKDATAMAYKDISHLFPLISMLTLEYL